MTCVAHLIDLITPDGTTKNMAYNYGVFGASSAASEPAIQNDEKAVWNYTRLSVAWKQALRCDTLHRHRRAYAK